MVLKTIKWLVILLVLLVIAAVIAVNVIDVNRFKPQIENFVSQTYQRQLKIDGDLSLKLFPRLALALPASQLSEPNSDSTALELESARVSVAVVPLISGTLEADKVQLRGLRATLVRRKDGSTSIDDLLGSSTGEQDMPADGEGTTGIGAFRIGGIELLDAAVTIRDEAAGSTITLSDVNLQTGELQDNQPVPVTLKARVQASNPALKADMALDATAQADLASGRYTVAQAEMTVTGEMDGLPIDQKILVSGLRGGAQSVAVDKVTVNSRFEQPGQTLVSIIATPIDFDIARGLLKLRDIDGKLDLTMPGTLAEQLAIPFSGQTALDLNAEKIDGALKLNAPEAAVDVSWKVKGFASPAIEFSLTGDTINLDRYLPPSPDTQADKPAAGAAASGDTDTPIDLSALNALRLNGQVTIARLIAQGLTVQNVKASVQSANGELNMAPVSLDLYGGSMKGRASVRSRDNRVVLSSDLTGVNIGPLLKDLTQDDLLHGNGEVRLRLQTSGQSVAGMKKALSGEARLALRDGAVMGINLGQKIRDARNMLSAGEATTQASDSSVKTDFASLTASFQISDGVAVNTDLAGKSPLIRIGGGGKVDIAAGSLDYTATASVVGTSKGQGGKEVAELRGVTIPVRLTGPFESLSWQIDWAEAARQALKSRAAEKLNSQLEPKKEELKEKARQKEAELKARKDEKLDELKEKAASKVGEKLKGLLGN